jgi:hypothetical protein
VIRLRIPHALSCNRNTVDTIRGSAGHKTPYLPGNERNRRSNSEVNNFRNGFIQSVESSEIRGYDTSYFEDDT